MSDKPKENLKLFSRLFPYIKPHRFKIALSMILALVVSSMEGAFVWLIKEFLDEVLKNKNVALLATVAIVIVVIGLIKGASRFGQSYFMRSVGQKVIMELRNTIYSHLQSLSLKFFHNNPSAVLMSRITNDVNLLASICSKVLADFFREICTVVILMGWVFYLNWQLAAVYVICLPFLIIPVSRVGKKLRDISRKNQTKVGELNTVLHETFTGCKIVKAFGMEEYENQRFQEENKQLFQIILKGVWADEMLSPLMEFFGAIGVAMVLYFGGQQVIGEAMTTGGLISFIFALGLVYKPIRNLSKMNNTFQQSMAAAERVFEITDTKSDIQEKPNPVKLPEFQEKIIFKDVDFAYTGNDIVLQNINLEVTKGEIVAFVGSSGAGKSTLVDLIPRFYDVSKGAITIDSVDIRDLELTSLRSQIGIVGQETMLFNDTIANNIAYGHREAPLEDVIAAAKVANAHEFIEEMPEGYDTQVGERGVKLSGGQRKRITIARALLKNPAILILDEATSELDSESELLVQKALEALMKGRTTLVIAHRLSTIRNANKIVAIDDGKIMEVGTHDELIKHDGVYKYLYELQFLHHKMPETKA